MPGKSTVIANKSLSFTVCDERKRRNRRSVIDRLTDKDSSRLASFSICSWSLTLCSPSTTAHVSPCIQSCQTEYQQPGNSGGPGNGFPDYAIHARGLRRGSPIVLPVERTCVGSCNFFLLNRAEPLFFANTRVGNFPRVTVCLHASSFVVCGPSVKQVSHSWHIVLDTRALYTFLNFIYLFVSLLNLYPDSELIIMTLSIRISTLFIAPLRSTNCALTSSPPPPSLLPRPTQIKRSSSRL